MVVHLTVDQNVYLVPNVIYIKHVSIKNVVILVLMHVVLMPNAEWLIIIQYVAAQKIILGIPLINVYENVRLKI